MNIEKAIHILEMNKLAIKETLEYEIPFNKEVSHMALDKEDLQALEKAITIMKMRKVKNKHFLKKYISKQKILGKIEEVKKEEYLINADYFIKVLQELLDEENV